MPATISQSGEYMKKILALILALILVLPLVSCKKKDDTEGETPAPAVPEVVTPLYYLDLSEYIEIEEKYYKNYKVEVKLNTVEDKDIDAAIKSVRASYPKLVEGDIIIEEGHIVSIFYKGYYLDGEDKVYFAGGSNVGGTPYDLEIGSGAFISGFEDGMIGKNPADYDTENPLVVETKFPDSYPQSPDLAGKTAYFEVTVYKKDDKYCVYELPELTESFIKETLKFTDEILAEYDGETVIEKYRSYVIERLKWSGISKEQLAWNAFWKSALEGAVVKKYPEKQLKEICDDITLELNDAYEYYNGVYTYEQFACLYFGVTVGSDWKAELESYAKERLKQYLILYHIMDVEGLDPTAEEYEKLFDEYLTEALVSQNITPENFNTEEEYLSNKEQYKSKMIAEKGEEYFKEMIYLSVGSEAIIGYADIIITE